MNNAFSREFLLLWQARLAEITADDRAALLQFAECLLVERGISTSYGDDITQRAFEAVLVGLQNLEGGRKPRLVNVASKQAFLNYMRGIVASLVYALTQKKEIRRWHQPWSDNMAPTRSEQLTPANQAELQDLREQLFPRMRARAPRRLLRTIDAWEAVFLQSESIPARGHRRYVREVRALAQEVLAELNTVRQNPDARPDRS
jgi:hypothetical protein